MIVLQEHLQLKRPVNEVFAYACEFANCAQWDDTAITSDRITQGATGVGSQYDVVCALPVGKINLHYEILHWQPNEQVVLRGSCFLFSVTDTITIGSCGDGSKLDYRAEFEFKPWLRRLESRMQPGLERMGKRSIEGLRSALETQYKPPTQARSTSLADRCVLPGLARFGKPGYLVARRNWKPVSAYMGDRNIVLTGATSGIGLAAAHQLALAGASLTLVARDESRGHAVIEQLQRTTGNPRLALQVADLSIMKEVEGLVDRLLQADRPIDVLINNAGALFNPRQETPEKLEKSFALLLLGPYLLTEGLLPLLQRSTDARVVNVVSGGMYTQKLEVNKLQSEKRGYSGSVAYARAKRALMIQTEQWAEAWRDKGIVCNAMHPGWADTPGIEQALPMFHKLASPILRTPEQGADTIVWLAAALEASKASGKLFLDREPHATHLITSTRESRDERQRLTPYLEAELSRVLTAGH